MKRTIIITALALGFAITTLNASTTVENSNLLELVKPALGVNPFCMSIAKGDIETVKKLIELGTDVNQKSNGMTPAMYAAKFNKTEILKLLVAKGADLKVKSDAGFKAIKYAQLSNAKESLEYLEGLQS
ncbi:MAG: ankyrin repeat domain-containing protein [Aquaticitalea sp.]